jgi:hypothetical protein
MRSTRDLLEQWRLADQAASIAETLITNQTLAYAEGKAKAPTEADWERVRALRALAKELFSLVMQSASRGSNTQLQ